ncbi:DNA polymerase I, partial [Candidatus Roizmanbacteria bacterium]|nr:DNA polymerase I [Candidatus Roizmanbacteria bacterium]
MKLVLIDGNAILHRAYHALPPLTDKDGNPTQAIYGFITMLLKIVENLKPTHLIVCFDRPEPTFRKTMYVGYQAHRPKMDDELVSQIGRLQDVVRAMKIPIYEVAGFEADDIIGSLAFQATYLNIKYQKSNSKNTNKISNIFKEIIIVTGDRDILQLVNDTVYVYMPIQGLTNAKLYGEKEVEEKFGVKPPQVVDYKALAGDASDNYPGVRGIGPKTATELLQTFGTVEKLYKAIKSKDQKIKGSKEKIIQALSEYAEDAVMAKKLATIVTDAPVTIDVASAKMHELNTVEAQEALEALGFRSLVKRLNHENTRT